MLRLSFLIFACCSMAFPSWAQQKSGRTATISKTFLRGNNPLLDTVFIQQVSKIYGGNSTNAIKTLRNDTVLMEFATDSTQGEFSSSAFTFQLALDFVGWVNDHEQIFSEKEIFTLDSILADFEEQTTNEIVVMTIDRYWVNKSNFDSLIHSIGNDWRIGKKEKNNGILIGFSSGLRSIRIENGDGIRAKLSDAETKSIIDDVILPKFREAKFFEGVRAGIVTIMNKIR